MTFTPIIVLSVIFAMAAGAKPGDSTIWKARRSDGKCGPNHGLAACRPDECCSSYGWCGSSEYHCNSESMWVGANIDSSSFSKAFAKPYSAPSGKSCSWKPSSTVAAVEPPTNPTPAYQPEDSQIADVAKVVPDNTFKALNWCGRHKVIALTFDDGPFVAQEGTQAILDDLQKFGIKATFFLAPDSSGVRGDRYRATQCQLLKRMVHEGHSVAGHTMRHPNLRESTDENIKKEIDDYNQWYRNCMKSEPDIRAIRPPYGDLTVAQRQYINDLGETVVTWNADSDDWRGGSAQQMFDKTLSEVNSVVAQNGEPASIILLHHDKHYVKGRARDVIPMYLDYFDNAGYKFVNLQECMALCQSTNDCQMPSEWPGVYGA